MFEYATKNHFRFFCTFGWITTEDLWSLPLSVSGARDDLASLDQVAKNLYAELQESEKGSFVEDVGPKSTELSKKLELVKHIIKVRKDERDEKRNQAAKKAEKEQLLEILHGKKVDKMKELSVQELEAKINALD